MFSHRSTKTVFACSLVLFSTALPVLAAPAKPASVPYTWKSVQMVGAGFIDGIVFHPTAKGVRYCRTDIGGAYRWNDTAKRWEPILDWLRYEDTNLMGVESIALDASDPNRVYLACGMYTNASSPNAAILRSSDRGKTWQRADMSFKMGGNENGRGNGERLAVDPNDGRILYFGSRQAGLWKSEDRGATWKHVDAFPDITEEAPPPPPAPASGAPRFGNRPSRGDGIVYVLFDPRSGSKGKASTTVYAGVSLMGRDNLYRSTDGGATWKPIPGEPTQYRPNRAVLASDGTLYLSYGTDPGPNRMTDGGVWKLNTATDAWTDITPDKPDPSAGKSFGYAAVSVDAHDPQTLIASSFGRYSNGGEEIFRSRDGGTLWKPIFAGGGKYDYSLAPYIAHTGIHWLFDIEIDPADPNHAMFTTGYGGHETFDLTDVDAGKPTTWSAMMTGVEESVALELISPTKGAPLLDAIGDYGGGVFWDLDKPLPGGNFDNPRFGNTTGIAVGDANPDVIVRVGQASGRGANIGYSLDGGKSWQPTATSPTANARGGRIAVSTDGNAWVWTLDPPRRFFGNPAAAPPDAPPAASSYVTRDKGATWIACVGVPTGVRVVADHVNPQKFYAADLFGGKLYTSTDGAATFAEQPLVLPDGLPASRENRGDNRGGQDRIYAAPDHEGDLWLPAFNGLYRSTDAGKTFARLGHVQEIHAFGFGKAAPHADYAALYLVGVVDGVRGFYRSNDTGATWARINDDQHQYGLVLQITGDPKQYGRVYVGTHGRGTVYGDPVR